MAYSTYSQSKLFKYGRCANSGVPVKVNYDIIRNHMLWKYISDTVHKIFTASVDMET
jgi:hypothetical protein